MTAAVLWVDASSGASGDMLLAALWDAGVPADVMAGAASAVARVEITFTREQRHGFAVARAHVRAVEDSVPHRTWTDVQALLTAADLSDSVRSMAAGVFERLAVAEARVHGCAPQDVHFHEVGALDAMADVVGVCAGLSWLDADLCVGPIALGGGTAHAGHGQVPAPVPAVLQLLRGAGAPASGGPVDVELCTPTGAALLTALASSYGPMPAMAVDAVGVGAGSRVLPDRLGALRVVLGRPVLGQAVASTDTSDAAVVLETNVDDLDPRVWPHVLTRLLEAGAQDAWLTPILMKKGRPAHTLHVLCAADPEARARLERLVFTETSAIGLRATAVRKSALERTQTTVVVGGQVVRVKVALLDGVAVNVQPEYQDVAAAALVLQQPVKVLLAQALAAATTTAAPLPG